MDAQDLFPLYNILFGVGGTVHSQFSICIEKCIEIVQGEEIMTVNIFVYVYEGKTEGLIS